MTDLYDFYPSSKPQKQEENNREDQTNAILLQSLNFVMAAKG